MRAARLALCCVAAASAKIGRIAAHGFVKGGQYRSAPLGRGTEAERAALEAARAAKAELDAENRLRRDSHRSWERRDNGTDRANATGGRAGAAADAIILEFPKSGRTWLFGLLTEAARLKGGRNFTVLRSHTMGVIDHPFLMSPDALAAAFREADAARRRRPTPPAAPAPREARGRRRRRPARSSRARRSSSCATPSTCS
jgi:hypothetical protein